MLPDADVIGFSLGVQYEDAWGHRGATHSIVFSLALGAVIGLASRRFNLPALRTGIIASLVLASHALLDTLTTGGLGCALFWPFDLTRYFAPWRPIPVSPIGLGFLSPYGLTVASIELLLFAPVLWYGLSGGGRRLRPSLMATFAVAWAVGSWAVAQGGVRDDIVGMVLRENTEFAPGYSEDLLNGVQQGEEVEAVAARLGRPHVEILTYGAQPATTCAVLFADGNAIVDMQPAAPCRERGITVGMSRDAATRILGNPAELCWLYSRSPTQTYFRVRAVCFENGRVSNIVRQWFRG
jgi:inner membrane protein